MKERPLYREDEKWNAIQFQTSKEEYTPWKGVLVEEEEVEVPDDRPLSWAELAKRKLYANGNADKSQLSKGEVSSTRSCPLAHNLSLQAQLSLNWFLKPPETTCSLGRCKRMLQQSPQERFQVTSEH